MHLELLKDLELMDFEGIYNVSSHPNTLYELYMILTKLINLSVHVITSCCCVRLLLDVKDLKV